jgi:hypothetical protein
MSVSVAGEAKLEFLDIDGKVVQTLAPERAASKP